MKTLTKTLLVFTLCCYCSEAYADVIQIFIQGKDNNGVIQTARVGTIHMYTGETVIKDNAGKEIFAMGQGHVMTGQKQIARFKNNGQIYQYAATENGPQSFLVARYSRFTGRVVATDGEFIGQLTEDGSFFNKYGPLFFFKGYNSKSKMTDEMIICLTVALFGGDQLISPENINQR